MFLTLSNSIALPGLGLSDWNVTPEGKSRSDSNVHLPATFFFFKSLLILRWQTQPSTLTGPQHLLVLISPASQEIGMQTEYFVESCVLCGSFPNIASDLSLAAPRTLLDDIGGPGKLCSFLEKIKGLHSLHLTGCNILFLRKPNPLREQRRNRFCVISLKIYSWLFPPTPVS